MLRNLLSNAAIKLTSNNLVVIGAGLQMLIFALNVTMLICVLAMQQQQKSNQDKVLNLKSFSSCQSFRTDIHKVIFSM